MPKIQIPQEESNYTSNQPIKYRKYTVKTKNKFCFLVKKLGWTTIAAAKLLKIKISTAKMILKRFKHGDFEGMQQIFHRNRNKKGENTKKLNQEQSEQQKSLESQSNLCYFVYYDFNYWNSFVPPQIQI